jgi:Ca2+-binding RTX toxin-like protein
MAGPSTLSDPGIISLDNGGGQLTNHFRLDLFQDDGLGNKVLTINEGELTLSDGFAGSLADALIADPTLLFDLGPAVDTFLVDDVDNLLALAKALKTNGLSVASLFEGGDEVGITIDEPDLFKLKQLLNGPDFDLFDFVTEVILPAGSTLDIDLHDYEDDLGIVFSGVSKITVTGSIGEYQTTNLNISSAPAIFEFVVLDTETNYDDANNADPSIFDDAIFDDVDVFGLTGTVTDLQEADFDSGTLASLGVIAYQAVDSPTNIDTALGNGSVDSLGLLSLVVSGDVAAIEGTGALGNLNSELAEGERVTGVLVADDFTTLDGADFDAGLMPIATDVHLVDDAANVPTPLDDSLFPGNPAVAPTLINLTGGTLDMSIDDMLDAGIQGFVSSGGTFNVGGSLAQLYTAEDELGSGDSILDRFESYDNVNVIGKGDAAGVDTFINVPDFDPAFVDLLVGFEVTAGTLLLGATTLYNTLPQPLYFNPVAASALIDVTGSASDIADAAFDAAGLITPSGGGAAIIHVVDEASEIRDNSVALGNGTAVIQGFKADYRHEVDYNDIYDAGVDTVLFTPDDVSTPLVSFQGGIDWYDLQADVFIDGAVIQIDGAFDVEWSGISDVLDISAQTGVLSDFDPDPASDFAFVSSLDGARSTVFGKPAVDIQVWPGSTNIDIDGLAGPYDGTLDFNFLLPDVDLVGSINGSDVEDGITVRNFFGIPVIDQFLHDDLTDTTLIPDLELLRFEGLYSYASAAQANNFLDEFFYQSLDTREQEIDTIYNVEGDILVGDNDGAGSDEDDYLVGDAFDPLVSDVIYGLGGNDIIEGLTGTDYLHGGQGNDTIMGGDGDDILRGDDEDSTGANSDVLHGGAGDDTLYGGEDDDHLHGGFNDDELFGGNGNDNLFGNDGDDRLVGGAGADHLDGGNDVDTADFSLTSSTTVNLLTGQATGPLGNDTLTSIENVIGSNFDDNISGDAADNALSGGAGKDIISGGIGKDTLSGGDGRDIFTYALRSEFGDTMMDFNAEDTGSNDALALNLAAFNSDVIYRSLQTAITTKTYTSEGATLTTKFPVFVGSGPSHVHMANFAYSDSYLTITDYFTSQSMGGIIVFTDLSVSIPTGSSSYATTIIKSAFQKFITDLYGWYATGSYGGDELQTNKFTKGGVTFTSTMKVPEATAHFVVFGLVNDRLLMASVHNGGTDSVTTSEVPISQMTTIATFQPGAITWGLLPHDILII